MAGTAPIGVIREAPKAGALLKPLRREILAQARTPVSAAGIAAAMKRPRQVINYHVRELARAGFLKRAGRVRKRGLYEQRYIVSAQAFVLAPELLGVMDAAAAGAAAASDKASASYLLMLATRLQKELSESWRKAEAAGTPLPLLSLDTEFAFASSGHRARFARALTEAITQVVAEHTVAGRGADSSTSHRAGGRYRLILGCYPHDS